MDLSKYGNKLENMHPDTFGDGDSVLLVGEGNFSFAVALLNLNLPITITATCLKSDVAKFTAENIAHLKQKGARVLLDVDATKLNHHPVIRNEKFSKIIFNFPHVGGKMKINLNRVLLKGFFQSASEVVTLKGKIIVSLCKGQGGTRADKPVRRWDDTWQVVDMAAHGNLILVSVEPFRTDMFPDYTSIGYRGGSSTFHTDGALVHVFSKTRPLYPSAAVETLSQYLEEKVIETKFGNIRCENIYNMKYRNSPFMLSGSAVQYLNEQLKTFVENYGTACAKVRCITDGDVSLHTIVPTGGPECYTERQEIKYFLRHFLVDSLDEIIKLWNRNTIETIIFPGLVFNKIGIDFSCPPLSCHVLLLGNRLSDIIEDYLKRMIQTFKKDLICVSESCFVNTLPDISQRFNSCKNIFIKDNDLLTVLPNKMLVAQEFTVIIKDNEKSSHVFVCEIYLDKLAKLLFDVNNWQQLWARESYVVSDKNIPVLKHVCFESLIYTFDISFTESAAFSSEKFCNILWHLAGDIITKVELLNVYESPEGWRSRCYRITYHSFEKALARKETISIQRNIIGKMLCVKLGVSMK